jgi:hypothetical protein
MKIQTNRRRRLCIRSRYMRAPLRLSSFVSLEHARATLASWQDDYNQHRQHGSLGHLTPSEFAKRGEVRGETAFAAPDSSLKLSRNRGEPQGNLGCLCIQSTDLSAARKSPSRMCATERTRVLHASSVAGAHRVAAWRTRLAIPLPPLPSSNLRLIQALQPGVEQNQRSPPTGCCMTGPWLL